MKITEIKTRHVGAPADENTRLDRNWTFVIIETDTDITGLGECTLLGMEFPVTTAIDRMSDFLVGQDPTRVEHLWQQMFRHPFWRGGPVLNAAISGVDMALWDIAGKAAGLPVYKMLGGPVRDRVRCYARPDLTGSVVDQAVAAKAQGFTGFKFGPEAPSGLTSDMDLVNAAVADVSAIRQAVGPEMDLMIDFHGRLNPPTAVKCLEMLRPFNLLFVEEVIPPDNPAAYAKVAAAVPSVPSATGERLYTRWGFRELIEFGSVPIIQPDICYSGGISELRRIAAYVEPHYVKVAPHNPNGPVACAASVHTAAAMPNFLILEYARKPPYFESVLQEPLVIKDGYFELPDRPGLGVELDEDFANAHPHHLITRDTHWYPDGSAADV